MTTGKEVIQECQSKMQKTIEATKEKFTSIRAGRASVAMLDTIKVEQYGSEMPLNQVATVSAPEARLLVIDPWDKTMIPKIEKAIRSEEHTSELQSRQYLVCRLLLEKKKN